MPTFRSDYAFGTANEKKSHSILENHFNKTLHYRGGSSIFDYDDGATFYLELKSRRIHHDTYDTTIIGANKVEYAKMNPSRTYWFCWNYEDGIYGIQFSNERFDGYEKKLYKRGERPDTKNTPQMCYFIPVSDLIRLS
jgi:hypothetical protein